MQMNDIERDEKETNTSLWLQTLFETSRYMNGYLNTLNIMTLVPCISPGYAFIILIIFVITITITSNRIVVVVVESLVLYSCLSTLERK
jgi:hypothetical protein